LLEARDKKTIARKIPAEGSDPGVAKRRFNAEQVQKFANTFELVSRESVLAAPSAPGGGRCPAPRSPASAAGRATAH
jgi:hypothetical protein